MPKLFRHKRKLSKTKYMELNAIILGVIKKIGYYEEYGIF
jgi:hypothetical protein